ncbi:condensin-2 complex subunit H2 [Pholidichthys leucotaenia]
MESTESRFAYLLQPIRDLTKNWEVDVASQLNDYLEELDEMCITFEGGKTSLNFAEAALLIQGSTCIYSKKVELLHSLVFQTLDYINERNKKRNKQAAAQEDGTDEAASRHDDDCPEFTEVDVTGSEKPKSDSNMTCSVTPLPPESLIAPETHEKNKLPLISVKGEILYSQKDFRINLFFPGEDHLIQLALRSARSTVLLHGPTLDPVIQQEQHLPDAVAPFEAETNGTDAADDFLPIEDNNMEVDPEVEEHVDRRQAVREGRMVQERRRHEATIRRMEDEVPPIKDLWEFHDPYAIIDKDKPLKPGKCYKVPDGLEDGGKRKRKSSAALKDFTNWFRETFDPPEPKFKNGPTFTDLNYIYLSTMKNKLKMRKRICRQAGVLASEEKLRETFLEVEMGPGQQREEPLEDILGGDNDHSDDEHEAFPDDIPAEFIGAADILPEDHKDELSYEELVKLRVEQLVINSKGYTQDTALSRRVKDWEDHIRPALAQEEERPIFDIHDYGDRIVGALGTVGHHRRFSSIVHGLDNREACRYLLASLQLANDYTVEIDSSGDGLENRLDTMGLTLLSTHRATDRFQTLTQSESC